ncbi:unnamed protein product [Dicrocoelium dendriticum]|nr:unnamed protein product [Dicrocoelium dendriticum]
MTIDFALQDRSLGTTMTPASPSDDKPRTIQTSNALCTVHATLKALYGEYIASLSRRHVTSPARMSHGTIEGEVVKITTLRGKYFRFMGFTHNNEQFLHAEEAVHLAQNDRLLIWDGESPLSMQEVYAQLLNFQTYPLYLILSHFLQFGYVLRKRDQRASQSRTYLRTSCKWTRPFPTTIPIGVSPLRLPDFGSEIKAPGCRVNVDDLKSLVDPRSILPLSELMRSLQSVVQPYPEPTVSSAGVNLLYDGYGGHSSSNGQWRITNFSKRFPPPPDFVIIKATPREPYPYVSQQQLIDENLNPSTTLILCVIDGSDVFFHQLMPFTTPILQYTVNEGNTC